MAAQTLQSTRSQRRQNGAEGPGRAVVHAPQLESAGTGRAELMSWPQRMHGLAGVRLGGRGQSWSGGGGTDGPTSTSMGAGWGEGGVTASGAAGSTGGGWLPLAGAEVPSG